MIFCVCHSRQQVREILTLALFLRSALTARHESGKNSLLEESCGKRYYHEVDSSLYEGTRTDEQAGM